MINNHMLMGENILKYSSCKYKDMINKKRFIWGNVKPDCVLKYKKMRHYHDESIDIIIEKILYLSSLTLDEVYYSAAIAKFSEELGVVCHFLCDFFCAPHYYRWECKSTKVMKEHMLYEKRLAQRTKTFIPLRKYEKNIDEDNLKSFLEKLQIEYKGVISYNNDLSFAYYVCESVINMIMKKVLKNKKEIKNAI